MVDPVTLTGLALAGLGGAIGGKALAGDPSASTPASTPQPTPPPAAPAPQTQPTARPQTASQQPTFLGAAAVPQQSGTKTLLGQ